MSFKFLRRVWQSIEDLIAGLPTQKNDDKVKTPTATKEQYDICKTIYDEEKSRFAALGSRANIYVTLVSFFLGAILFQLNGLKAFLTDFHVPEWIELFVGISLIGAMSCTVLALVLRKNVPIQSLFVIIKKRAWC